MIQIPSTIDITQQKNKVGQAIIKVVSDKPYSLELKPSCGCTVVEKTHTIDGTKEIKVGLTARVGGRFTKTIRYSTVEIGTGESTQGVIKLNIKIDV